jgi:hypothetical protein
MQDLLNDKNSRLNGVSIISWLLLLVFTGYFSTSSAMAQYRSSIQGVVTDPQGNVIPEATVTLTDTATNQVTTSTTSGAGVYNFNALPPSSFTLAAEAKGFKKKVLSNVRLIPEQANAVNLALEVGEASETVTVNVDEAPNMDTATASIGATVSSNEIQHLPSFGRDVFQLAQLAPGVFGDGGQSAGGGSQSLPGSNRSGSGAAQGIFQTENAPQIVANGGHNENNGITVDGISTVSAVWGGASVITPSEDSVDNVKIVANSYDAESGRFSGAQVQVTSKSGSNQLHGSLFFKADRPGLNAYQRWNGPGSNVGGTPSARGVLRNTNRFNQFGGSLGGPIWKDKIFAFFNYETLRNNTTATANGWYDTPQYDKLVGNGPIATKMLTYPGESVSASSVLNQTCANIGLTEGVRCRTIAGQGLDIGSPLKSAAGTHDPGYVSSGNPGVGGGLDGVADIAQFSTVNPTNQTYVQYNGRMDANVTSKDRLTFAIYWVPADVTNYQGPIRSANLWHHSAINDAFSGLWNHTFSSTLLNEARFNAAGWRWNEITSNPQEPFGLPQSNFGSPNAPTVFGSISNSDFQYLGAPGPSVFNQWTYSYQDVMTKVAGRHIVKFGGGVTRLYYLNEASYNARPVYNFVSLWDYLNDAPYSEAGNFNPLTGTPTANRQDIRSNLYGFFVQDDFKVTPTLTLNLGLRYDYLGPITSKQNNLNVVQLGTGSTTLTGLNIRQGGSLYDAQKGNFGPRLGFAWSPSATNGRFVLRGGFGMSYNQEEIAIASNGANNPPSVVGVSFCCSSSGAPNSNIQYGVPSDPKSLFGYPPNSATIVKFNSAGLPTSGGPIAVVAYPSSLPTQYTYHYSLDTQYDLGHGWIASLGYQGSEGHHQIRHYNTNVLAVAQGIPLNPQVQTVDTFGAGNNNNNNSLLAGIKHQFSHSFLIDMHYSWAKALDNGSQPYYEDPYPYYNGLSWGPSDFNVAHALKIYGLWQPKFFTGSHAWIEKVAGGWSLSGIFNLHSGFPWTPEVSTSNLYYQGSGYATLRPAAYFGGAGRDTSNDAFRSGPSRGATYNQNFSRGALAYFAYPKITASPAFPSAGSVPVAPGVGRNSFLSPGYNDFDATLSKGFGLPKLPVLGENAKIEIRADAFNLFNKLNLLGGSADNGGSINNIISNDGTTSNPAFGQAQKALGSRTVELQARFSF